MSDNLPQFLADMDRIEASIPLLHRDAQVELLALGYQVAIDGTPVKTGALRAENVVTLGDPQAPSDLLYEAPGRPGPNLPVPFTGSVVFEPPSARDARAALANVEPFQHLGVLNQRFYAPSIHDGTPEMAPRPWMDHARDYVELVADSIPIDETRLR